MSEKLNVYHFIHIDYNQKSNYAPYSYYDSIKYYPYYDYLPRNRQSYLYWPHMENEFYNSYPYENNGYEWEKMWPFPNYNYPFGQSHEKESYTKKDFSPFDKQKLKDIKKKEIKDEKCDKTSENKEPNSEIPPKKETSFLGILKKNIQLNAKKEN